MKNAIRALVHQFYPSLKNRFSYVHICIHMKSQPGSDLGEHLGGGININLELVTNILMNFKLILI